jgi:ABC-type uncharacterized transport system involved in gliding motility auxiliary subunit
MKRSAIQRFLREYGFITGPVSLAALAAAVFRKLVLNATWSDPWFIGLLVGGVLLGAAFILGNPTEVRTAITKRGTLYGLNAAAMSLAFVAILVLLNYVAGLEWATYKHDFTKTKIHTLSPQSVQVVAEVAAQVHIVGFFGADEYDQQKSFEELLDQYERADKNDFLEIEYIDPDLHPDKAWQYEEPYQGLLIQSGARSERVYVAREQDITSALLTVSSEEAKVVYFLSGHGERDPDDGSEQGYSTVAQDLRRQNYDVQSLSLALTDTIPSDASVIVIAGPQAEFLPEELAQLQSYLTSGGRALIMQDPLQDETLDLVLANWQVRFGEGFVVDEGSSLGGAPFAPAVIQYNSTPVTTGMNRRWATYYLLARPVEQTAETPPGVTYSELFQTTAQSWSEMNTEEIARDELDTPGPLALAALIESPPQFVSADSTSTKTRIVLIGDSDFAANANVGFEGNLLLFSNAINWLAEEEQLIAIGPKDAGSEPIAYRNDVERSVIFFINLCGIPGLIFAAGIAVWVTRRMALSSLSNAPGRQDSDETA